MSLHLTNDYSSKDTPAEVHSDEATSTIGQSDHPDVAPPKLQDLGGSPVAERQGSKKRSVPRKTAKKALAVKKTLATKKALAKKKALAAKKTAEKPSVVKDTAQDGPARGRVAQGQGTKKRSASAAAQPEAPAKRVRSEKETAQKAVAAMDIAQDELGGRRVRKASLKAMNNPE